MDKNNDMQAITRRLLALWQEQMSLMSQDPETLSYGDNLFKAMGMPVPDVTTTKAESPDTQPSQSGQSDGTSPDELSPEQRAAMVDELTSRINELASQIAEYEANAISSEPDGKS